MNINPAQAETKGRGRKRERVTKDEATIRKTRFGKSNVLLQLNDVRYRDPRF